MTRKSRRGVGGVAPQLTLAPPVPAAVSAGISPSFSDFAYNGGPVIRSPQVYTSFWGLSWADAPHAARQARLNQFVGDLIVSEYMNVLSQYGVGAGNFVSTGSVPGVAGELDEAGIAETIQSQIDIGALPEPPASDNQIVLIIYLDESIAYKDAEFRMCEPDGDNAFGFHSDFVTAAGNEFYYAIIPALHDQCLRNTCPDASACSLLLSQSQEDRLTQVTSHEFAEMCTDPKFQQGWFGASSDENGDICNARPATLTVGVNTWNVQLQYSKTDDENSAGGTYCVLGAAAPMPKRPEGPA